ncbi:MAG TPA: hypothetical protein VK066_04680 [Chloroflexota bacterium]|nr:hypothetical protein [Chloroflexota bacterium]
MAKYWLAALVLVGMMAGLVYGVAQQLLRTTANDPQIALSEDAAARLASGAAPAAVVPAQAVDIGASLAPYLIVYDDQGQPVASSASLDGQTPALPSGVFGAVQRAGERRFTWQPAPRVRSAVVVAPVGGPRPGFVLAGRSLREVERRENALLWVVAAAWIAMSAVVSAPFLWHYRGRLRRNRRLQA